MNSRTGEAAAIGVGLAYLLALGWAIGNTSYDVWGVLIVTPVYGLIGAAFVRRTFRGSLQPLATVMLWGLLIKFGGTLARYWVGFEAYGGGIDASQYHAYGVEVAGKVWSGEESFFTALPHGQGTEFLQNLTAFLYTITGGSQLAGFVTFSFLAYIGTVLMVKAAAIAVPGLAAKRYAWMCAAFPSVVYWPASIGKEAAIMLGLGVATLGIATMLTRGRWISSILLIAGGLGLTFMVRPHVAGVWIAGALPALVVALVRRSRGADGAAHGRKVNKFGIVLVLGLAAGGLALISSATVRYLAPGDEEGGGGSVTTILETTTLRTSKESGSTYTPPSVSSPATWPYAAVRTLTRPLPFEARGVAQLIAAAEMMALIGILVLERRRLYNLPRLLVSSPYVTFAVTTLLLAGLAYSSFANLGILTRQKSLVFPLMLLLPCLPARQWRAPSESLARDAAPATASSEQRRPSPATAGPTSDTGSSSSLPAPHARMLVRPTTSERTDLDELWA